jgi:sec-independent protein translocase protein TatA
MRLGGWEIALIAVVVILVFGVGKLANVGGALGKSIREFRREIRGEKDDNRGNTQQLTTKESREEKSTPPEAKSKEKSED